MKNQKTLTENVCKVVGHENDIACLRCGSTIEKRAEDIVKTIVSEIQRVKVPSKTKEFPGFNSKDYLRYLKMIRTNVKKATGVDIDWCWQTHDHGDYTSLVTDDDLLEETFWDIEAYIGSILPAILKKLKINEKHWSYLLMENSGNDIIDTNSDT